MTRGIHGVPASGMRFDELGDRTGRVFVQPVRAIPARSLRRQAWGRDRAFEPEWQPFTGLGAAVNFRAPWNTILRADFGKSVLPPDIADRFHDSADLILKPLK